MSQSTDITLAPNITGTAQRTELNDILAAILTGHSGASRPSYLTGKTGGWTKIVSGTVHELYYFDGADDILMGTLDLSTNTFSPSGQSAGFANTVSNKTAAYTIVDGDCGRLITGDATSAAFTLAIAATAGLRTGWFAIVQKTDATANTVTIDPDSANTVNGVTTLVLSRQFDAAIVVKTGATSFAALLLPSTSAFATLTSPAFTGTPTTPTGTPWSGGTQIASQAYADERGVPPGAGMDYWGNTLPSAYLWAAGQAVSRTTYANLFAAIGTTHGAGDGSTTFNLPDKRGRASVGKDDMNGSAANRMTNAGSGITGTTLGASGGAETVTLTTGQMPVHTHTGTAASAGAHTHTIQVNSNNVWGNNSAGGNAAGTSDSSNDGNPSTASNGAHTHTLTIDNAGSGNAHSNTQPSIICNHIIKT